jgi:group I intron endonuclease
MYIYQITNKITTDTYIGKTVQMVEDRFYSHKYNASKTKSQTYLYRAMRKYGIDNFEVSIVDTALSLEELNQKEIEYIAKLKPKYNMTNGGDGGDTLSSHPNRDNIIKGFSERTSGKNNPMYGRKRPDTAIYLLKGRDSMLRANRCPVICEGLKFDSVGAAQEHFKGISIRKRLDNPKYPEFCRLREKTKRK